MNGVEKRLLPAGLLALIVHSALLSWQLAEPAATLPTPLPCQRVTVSLGVREVAREQPPEPKHIQHAVEKKILPAAKPTTKVHKQDPVKKPALLPESKPRPVARKNLPEKPQTQTKPEQPRTAPSHQEQSVDQPLSPAKKTPVSNQPSPESAATSPQAAIENESSPGSTASARVIQQATPLYQINPPPRYPRLARRRGLEGVVLLSVLVDISGWVADLKLARSSGHPSLDRAALNAVRRWRFTQGNQAGGPMKMRVTVPVRFKLGAVLDNENYLGWPLKLR